MRKTVQWSTLLIVASAAIAGCKGKDNYADTTRTDTAGSAAATTASTPQMTDQNVVAILDAVNVSDSAAGAIAAQKGTSNDVKEFGRTMMRDHHALREQSMQVAQKANVQAQMPQGDTTETHLRKMQDSLNAMPKGRAWDQFYIANEVAAHDAALKVLQSAQGTVQNADLRGLIEQARPAVEGHLSRARAIQQSLGNAPAGDSTKAGATKRP
jgi:putative membrane protein